jgi:hypothetical protein
MKIFYSETLEKNNETLAIAVICKHSSASTFHTGALYKLGSTKIIQAAGTNAT